MVGKLSKHAEWLSLIEISGPFLTVSMLEKAFPQGLDTIDTPRRQKLRAAYEEWREAVDQEDKLLSELHQEWVRLVLTEILEYDHVSLVQATDWPRDLPTISSQDHAATFSPDLIVYSHTDEKPRLFITVMSPDTDLESVQRGDGWPVSLQERMTLLCRAHGVRVGLLTDGERWMVVNAPIGSTSSHASWYARLWFQEPITLKAFLSLLGVRRCYGPADDTLESLLEESLKHHEEVTNTLGEQVRRAVEVLVQCLDKADEDRNRELLHDMKPAEFYEAGLTVMMRLVFILCAEERGLLLFGDSVYDRCYAVSTLRGQLSEEADRYGPEVLGRRHDAWARLLAMFRAIYGGIDHESLRMPALGGSLFDPDRFPFLEGRATGTHWRDTPATSLPIDNRTVLLLLNSLQILEQSGGALLLSYRALDVEQIGHVYEGLLEHTVTRVPRLTLGLLGSQKAKNPNVALEDLESARLDGETGLVNLLLEITGRSESAIENGLTKPADDTILGRVFGVCGGDTGLAERIQPFTNLLRADAWGDPIVYRENSFMVTLGADRRETGTHYTPKSLTESIVTTTLEPLVYVGPSEGKPHEVWTLKSSREILNLKVCDPAMGSGAFLVQTCLYLGEKLVEAWLHEEEMGKVLTVDGAILDQLGAEEPLPPRLDERLAIARCLVAERCLYGVDINPLAVELAKLSIWLVTLAKGRPFGFLDHNLRSGDSLIGIHRLDQLTKLLIAPTGQGQQRLFGHNVERAVQEGIQLRQRMREMPIRDIHDVEAMAQLDAEARRKLEVPECIADAFIGEIFASGGNVARLESVLASLTIQAGQAIDGDREALNSMRRRSVAALSTDLPDNKSTRRPFHWPLELPEVCLVDKGGFDAFVGNPPFLGGKRIGPLLGDTYNTFLKIVTSESKGAADLSAYFFRRAFELLRNEGCLGLLATNSISQADTREVGLDPISNKGGIIFAATSLVVWPGTANVHASIVHIKKGKWLGDVHLDGEPSGNISTRLSTDLGIVDKPFRLKSVFPRASGGTGLLGIGFVVDVATRNEWVRNDPKYSDILWPYINGKDLNTMSRIQPPRYVINFEDKSESEAEQYLLAINRVRELVKPQRDVLTKQIHESCYWKHWDKRAALYGCIKGMHRVLVCSFVSKHLPFTFLPGGWVYSKELVVIPSDSAKDFSILQSSIHGAWVRHFSGTLKSDLSYSISDGLRTFPLPSSNEKTLEVCGQEYWSKRQFIMESLDIGMTELYNKIHSNKNADSHNEELRELHRGIDIAVVRAYGWDDLDLDHSFHEVPYLPENDRVRFTISEPARVEILRRLSELNHQRYSEENDKS